MADYERKRHLAVSRQADLKEKLQNKQKPNIEQLEFIMKENSSNLANQKKIQLNNANSLQKEKNLWKIIKIVFK